MSATRASALAFNSGDGLRFRRLDFDFEDDFFLLIVQNSIGW